MRWNHAALRFAPLALLVAMGGTARSQDAGGTPAALALGSPAPLRETLMKGVDGHDLSIASAAGKKGTLVLFICNHCPWVKAWQTRLTAIGNSALANGVGVIAINSNDPDVFPDDAYGPMQKRAKDAGYRFAYVVDATSDVARAFGATHTPEAYLFDAKGKLVYHGAIDDNAQNEKAVTAHWLADAVAALEAGKPVATAETKALGCGIRPREKRTS